MCCTRGCRNVQVVEEGVSGEFVVDSMAKRLGALLRRANTAQAPYSHVSKSHVKYSHVREAHVKYSHVSEAHVKYSHVGHGLFALFV